MLVPYSGSLSFPGGAGSNYTVSVRTRASNQLALLFTDATGSVRADNPVTTDDFGTASFYAAPGDYVSTVAGETFEYQLDASVTDPVRAGLWIHTQTEPATVWTIAHHFGVPPHVDVLVSGEGTQASVAQPDSETTTLTFAAPTAGTAYLRA